MLVLFEGNREERQTYLSKNQTIKSYTKKRKKENGRLTDRKKKRKRERKKVFKKERKKEEERNSQTMNKGSYCVAVWVLLTCTAQGVLVVTPPVDDARRTAEADLRSDIRNRSVVREKVAPTTLSDSGNPVVGFAVLSLYAI